MIQRNINMLRQTHSTLSLATVLKKQITIAICAGASAVLLLVSGCGTPSTVDAEPRNSPFTPTFGEEAETESNSESGLKLNFISSDHFACLTADVKRIRNNPDFKETSWDSIEEQLGETIGKSNAQLENLERVWITLDRSAVSPGEGQNISPMLTVLDLAKPVDKNELAKTAEASILKQQELANNATDNQSKGKEFIPFTAKILGPKRIAIGSQTLLERLEETPGNSDLADLVYKLPLSSEIEGVVAIEPIRGVLQKSFDMLSAFGGDQFAAIAKLPDVTQHIDFNLSLAADRLAADRLAQFSIFISDPEMAKDLARMGQSTSEAASGMFSMLGGGGPGAAFGGQAPKMFVDPTSTSILEEVGTEIQENSLFNVVPGSDKVTFALDRPSKTKELIQALITDGAKQIDVVNRAMKLKSVAGALKKYEQKYDCLPPSGAVTSKDLGIPMQLNWRTGLLPFLGQQELYDQFNFEEPWDSEHNLELAQKIPDVFSTGKDSGTDCRLHLIGGDFGIHGPAKESPTEKSALEKLKLDQVVDKKIWTAIVLEGNPENVHPWTKPGASKISAEEIEKLGDENENGLLLINGAFEVRGVVNSAENVAAVLTISGDEKMRKRDFIPLGL